MIAALTFQAIRADAVASDEASFVPITPCRLIDTRPDPDRVNVIGAFGNDNTRTVQAVGTNGNCTIPADAVGLSLNVTALGATAPTFLTIWPDGTRPKASSLNPAPGQPPTPNAVTTNLSGSGAFNVYNKAGTLNVIIDINGYYTKASFEALDTRLAALEAANPGPRIAVLEAQQPPILVEHAETANVDEAIFSGGAAANILTVTIDAPASGDLIITGAIAAFGGAYDRFACSFQVDGVSQGGSVMWDQVHNPGSGHTDNFQSGCNPTMVKEVTAGVHTITLRVDDRATVQFDDASLWAIWTRT